MTEGRKEQGNDQAASHEPKWLGGCQDREAGGHKEQGNDQPPSNMHQIEGAPHRPITCGPESEGKREVQHVGTSVHT